MWTCGLRLLISFSERAPSSRNCSRIATGMSRRWMLFLIFMWRGTTRCWRALPVLVLPGELSFIFGNPSLSFPDSDWPPECCTPYVVMYSVYFSGPFCRFSYSMAYTIIYIFNNLPLLYGWARERKAAARWGASRSGAGALAVPCRG